MLRTDWQNVPHSRLQTADAFLRDLADTLADQLGMDGAPEECFPPNRPVTRNFERFFRRYVLTHAPGAILWGIDEADRLFDCPEKDDVFGMLRSWHNERSLDSESEWHRLTVVIAYATEAHLISNLNMSPFNVGYRVNLHDFTQEQVQEMNQKYGSPVASASALESLTALVGGHPYLVRRSFQEMTLHRVSVAEIVHEAELNGGIYRDHLERLHLALQRDPQLYAAARACVKEDASLSEEQFDRLCAAGLFVGPSRDYCQPRCRLYACFLRREK